MTTESLWRRELEGFLVPTPLWLDRFPGRAPSPGSVRRVRESAIPASDALMALRNLYDLSLSAVLGTAWAFVLFRLTGERDVMFGEAVAAPVQMLPVRVKIEQRLTFLDLMRDLQQRQEVLL